MAEEDETQALEVVNEAATAAVVSSKGPLSHQPKSSNDFMAVLSNSLQEHSRALQV